MRDLERQLDVGGDGPPSEERRILKGDPDMMRPPSVIGRLAVNERRA